ncbi:MAG: hypothetical protein JWO06_2506 [Bacteroidota bacterium]|nr:hypothetical protein [Bacteroidota bacterium]
MKLSAVAKRFSRLSTKFFVALLFGFAAIELVFRLIQFGWPPLYQLFFDDKNKLYVYMVGESTAEGVQYQDKISPAKLVAYQFGDSLAGKPIEIISVTKSGPPLEFHYFRLFFELLFRPHKNGLVLVYSGINEATGNTNPTPDFEFWKIIQHSIVLSKLYYMYRPHNNCPQKFEYRYHQLMRLSKQHHYTMVVSQLVGNIGNYDPEVTREDDLMLPENREALHIGKRLFSTGKFKEADSIFEGLGAKFSSEQAHLLYFRGRCKYEQGQYDSAAIFLNRAPEIHSYIGFARWKNKIIEQVAAEENIPVAHVFNRLMDSSEHQLLGYNLINDAHHPNLKGYCLMADEISQEVSKLYGDKIKRVLTPEIVEEHFKFDDKFYASVYYRLVEWFIFECVETQERDLRMARLKFYLAKYEGLDPKNNILFLWKAIIAVLENNQQSFLENFNRLEQSNEKESLLNRLRAAFEDKPGFRTELKSIVEKWQLNNAGDIKLQKDFVAQLP